MNRQFKDLFISYGRRESLGFVGRLHQRLKLAGYDAWFDKVNIPDGDDYAQRINHGIESAHNIVYVMAPRCLTSPYCLIELEYARFLGKRLIPINQMVIFNTASRSLSEGDKQALADFYRLKQLPDPHIQTTQHVLDRSLELIGRTDWLDAKEHLTDNDGQRLADWAQHYENHWAKHEDLNYLNTFEFPIFGQPIDTLDSVVERLTAVLERQQPYVHQHTQILSEALWWQQNQKDRQYLLVGKERTAAEEWLLTEFLPPKQPPGQPSALVCEFICEARKNAENLMTDIFICYDIHHDKAMRDSVVQSLSRYAKTTWRHDYDIQTGDNYECAIEQGIENADNFFYFISPHSVVSDYCQRELDYALKYNKRIVPLLIAPTPDTQIPMALRHLQYVDFTDNTCQADYDSDIDDILNILRHDQEYYEQHKILLARALKWQVENRKPSFLLRGHNLDNAKTWLRLNETREHYPPTDLHKQLITASEAAKGQLGTEVFISYSRKDGDFARRLNMALQEAGKTTWFDQESISSGVNFEQEIFKGIDGADNFIFVISQDAVQSDYCEREVNYAAAQNKRFISVLHRDTDPAIMPDTLRVINWIDFKDTSFDKSFAELIQAIELDRDHVHQHTVLQQRASDWDDHNRSKDFLLNITACNNAEIWRDQALETNKQPAPTLLQQDFIQESRQNIESAKLKERHRRNLILASVTGGMIIAIILAGFAWLKMNEAEKLYQELFKGSELTQEQAQQMAERFIHQQQKQGKIFRDPLKEGGFAPEMIWLPSGQFRMGDIEGRGESDETPLRHVSIKRFAIGRYEVTVSEFRQFVAATQYQTEAEQGQSCNVYQAGQQVLTEANWRNPGFPQVDNQPVVCVSWNDAVAYTQWLSQQTGQTYRLPSEAEWEYAARAGKETAYWWGKRFGRELVNCQDCDNQWSNQQTAPINSLIPNLFGIYHIVGNVWEWVADPWHDNYDGAPSEGRVWEEDGNDCLRVFRGGGWHSEAKNLRLANRHYASPHERRNDWGFRVVRSAQHLANSPNIKPVTVPCQPVFKGFLVTKKQAEEQARQFITEEEGRVFRDILKDGTKGPEMVWLPAGQFRMGDIQGVGDDDEKPVHEVSIKRFAIGRYEVTFAEYDRFVQATGRKKPNDQGWGRGQRPVINVSWNDAVAYVNWLSEQTDQSYRLPSEAEWEYAARAGTETLYWWGNEPGSKWGNFRESDTEWSGQQTAPVGSFVANPFGIYDTAGNVWEWTADSWHNNYEKAPVEGHVWKSDSDDSPLVMRGGSCFNFPGLLRAANRDKDWNKVSVHYSNLGFRLVRD